MITKKAQTAAASTFAEIAERKIVDHAKWDLLAAKQVVLTKGTFDILHAGHLALLAFCAQKAKELGPDAIVVVVLETDESVRRRKGEDRPYQNQSQRALQMALLSNVHAVVLAAKSDLPSAINAIGPRIYVKGMDTAGIEQLSEAHDTTIHLDVTSNPELSALEEGCDIVVFTDNGSVSTSFLVDEIKMKFRSASRSQAGH